MSRFSAAAIAVALIGLTLAVYSPVRDNLFVNLDDWVFIVDNPDLPHGLAWEGIRRAVATTIEAYWLPLTALSFQASWQIHGFDPRGYHLTDVALHTTTTLALWRALALMTGNPWRSAFVAAVFAVHPLHVESVAWATERKDTLSGLMFALGLWTYGHHARRPSGLRMSGTTLLFTLGLLAKPTLVTAPFVLLLLDAWPLRRWAWPRVVVEKLPLFGVCVLSSALTIALQRDYGALSFGHDLTAAQRLGVAVQSFWWYVGAAFWPNALGVFYPYPRDFDPTGSIVATLALLVTTAVVVVGARRWPAIAVGWLWFGGMLVPMSGIVQAGMQARADRFMHLPLIGLSIAATWGVADVLRRIPRVLIPIGVGVIGLLAITARQQTRHWHDSISLFEHALTVSQDNYFVHFHLAEEYLGAGDRDRAERHFRDAAIQRPGWARPRKRLAEFAQRRGELAAARTWLEESLPGATHDAELHTHLGILHARLGNHAAAIHHQREAARLSPGPGWALNNLAWLLATAPDPALRDPAEAVRLAEELTVGARVEVAWLDTLGAAYAAVGRWDDAHDATVRGESLARARGDHAMVEQLRNHRAQYARGAPLTDPVDPRTAPAR